FVDAELGIVEALVIVLGTVENHSFALEDALVPGFLKIAPAKILRDHTHLHDREIDRKRVVNGNSVTQDL
ncbi:hypothetical protein ACCS97_37790, partial [Rhizobium ruizarguesonis]